MIDLTPNTAVSNFRHSYIAEVFKSVIRSNTKPYRVLTFKSKLRSTIGTNSGLTGPISARAYKYNKARPFLSEMWKKCLSDIDNTKDVSIKLCQVLLMT